jgi:ubiquinone/menaquinone biosynthesis C-methylase UbiE
MATDKNTPQKGFRIRITLFLLGIILVLVGLNVLNQAINTLHELTRVEAERDQWQRPADVLQALDLKPGSIVVDLGSGAGYFALKISKSIGDRGEVLAVDLRRLSLTFLWIRSVLQHSHNVSVIVGEPGDPHLGATVVDSVLVANTYHEFEDSKPILNHIFRSLRRGGRLVIVDRGPVSADAINAGVTSDAHEIAVGRVENELARGGFTVVSSDPNFIDRPGDHWWLIVAQKPQ